MIESNTPTAALQLTNTLVTLFTVPGTLRLIDLWNPGTAVAYVQLFDATSGVTIGTTTPLMSFGLPAGGGRVTRCNFKMTQGLIVCAATAYNGASAPQAAQVCNFEYRG